MPRYQQGIHLRPPLGSVPTGKPQPCYTVSRHKKSEKGRMKLPGAGRGANNPSSPASYFGLLTPHQHQALKLKFSQEMAISVPKNGESHSPFLVAVNSHYLLLTRMEYECLTKYSDLDCINPLLSVLIDGQCISCPLGCLRLC